VELTSAFPTVYKLLTEVAFWYIIVPVFFLGGIVMAGVISRGIVTPIIKEGDDLVSIVRESLISAMEADCFKIKDRDIVAITESVLARADGNYASIDEIAADVKNKVGSGEVGLVFPIFSRNRFAVCLKAIARAMDKIYIMLPYPSDEVGNELVNDDVFFESGLNPYADTLSLDEFREKFGITHHPFTGVDYVGYYDDLIREEGCEPVIIFSNRAEKILDFTENVLCCDIHNRERTKARVLRAGGKNVLTLCDIMNAPVDGSGFCPKYGLLGSNKASDESVKLFPKNSREFVDAVQADLKEKLGVNLEVMVYGDGAFKSPTGRIWEFADPEISPAYTAGLDGMPNEVKIKYIADNEFEDLSGAELQEAIRAKIRSKKLDNKNEMLSEGTTPRKLTELLGSLCDLTSGSGDKGTPVVLVQNYFSNYADV
jgi:F420-0:gamma-glutamyl ligase